MDLGDSLVRYGPVFLNLGTANWSRQMEKLLFPRVSHQIDRVEIRLNAPITAIVVDYGNVPDGEHGADPGVD